jgi:hypothetical protein
LQVEVGLDPPLKGIIAVWKNKFLGYNDLHKPTRSGQNTPIVCRLV